MVTLRPMTMAATRAQVVGALLTVLTLCACANDATPPPSASTRTQGLDEVLLPTPSAPTPPAARAKPPRSGDSAVWQVAERASIEATATGFTADVSRLACNSGVTGKVLAPSVEETPTTIIVTFAVAPVRPGAKDCQSNNSVPHVVRLREPLGDRVLVDGSCLPGGDAETTNLCNREGVRYDGRAFSAF